MTENQTVELRHPQEPDLAELVSLRTALLAGRAPRNSSPTGESAQRKLDAVSGQIRRRAAAMPAEVFYLMQGHSPEQVQAFRRLFGFAVG